MKRYATLTNSIPTSSASNRLGDRYLWVVSIVFTGLALGGKGFAYLFPAPFFVSEVTMIVGLLIVLRLGNLRAVFRLPQAYFLCALALWGTYRTLPFIPIYQIDAIRDAFLWAYMGWAFVIAGLVIAKPERLNMILRWFVKFSVFFLVASPLCWVASKFLGQSLPSWPWASNVKVVMLKGGDSCVILAMIIAFWCAGFSARVRLFSVVALLTLLGICGSFNRGGLMAFMLAMFLCMICKPRSPWPWRVLSSLAFGMILLFVSAIEIQIPGRVRAISFDQFLENFASVFGSSKAGDLDATKEWRKEWWDTIIQYSVHGPYKWSGKGFGINLADDDGFQVGGEDDVLRSPHNGHMNILARSGLPGLTLWALVHGSWGVAILVHFLRSRHRRDGQWPNLFMWLGATFAACCFNASVDVYLEGPMGGVPLWCVYGLGLASMYLYKYQPHILRHPADPIPFYNVDAGYERYAPPTAVGPSRVFGPARPARDDGKPAQLAPFDDLSRN